MKYMDTGLVIEVFQAYKGLHSHVDVVCIIDSSYTSPHTSPKYFFFHFQTDGSVMFGYLSLQTL